MAVEQSRYARMHKDSHTEPLHDATAQMADEARMLTNNNLYNFSSKVLTNYNNILQNPFKFVILYQKDQKTKRPKEPKDR